jgi:CheY-like chemotaxis protein
VKTILLADDSITIQKVVELTFSDGDYQVVCVSNGAQALRKIPDLRPDLVLLDVIMPEKNGYEVCEALKRNPATAGIPVLLLTGTFEPFDKKRAEQVGADGHLTKPFESQLLVSRVEALIAATPRVASSEQAGVMDVISGGEVYRVDPGAADGMRRVPAAASAGQPAAAAPIPPPGPAPREDTAGATAAPATLPRTPPGAPPEADPGGAYVGFADVGFGAEEPRIVPDRFDDPPAPSTSTVRVRRDEVVPSGPLPDASTAREPEEAAAPTDPEAGGEFTGVFESEFELQDDVAAVPVTGPRAAEETEWSPPPEAPPAETWVADERRAAGPPPGAPAAAAAAAESAGPALRPGSPAPGNGQPGGLTPEAIELIAEEVVQRLSDRVIREIAWEVIPEVAEAIVRRRIKELEESPAD